ncbi:MAG: GTP 3',8-cyclase MoaA [Bryobacteraceae bacterium]
MSAFIQIASNPSPAPVSDVLADSFGRIHSDLRVSVTDRCNIRCFYCMPEEGAQFTPVRSLLSFAQIERFVSVALPLGIRKIRLTGGEPLLRRKLPELIAPLAQMRLLEDLALTTNGVLLATAAKDLYDAGLRRLNVHLDTLNPERFHRITRRNDLARVLNGIEAARKVGFTSIKLNAVAMKGVNEDDIVPLVRFARERNLEARFIEFMPLDAQQLWSIQQVLTADQMIAILEREFGPLTAVSDADPRAPATAYRFADGHRIGFIASVSRPFCLNCNRLRLTADGKLRNCLFAHDETDVSALLSRPDTDQQLIAAIRQSVWNKGPGHEINRPGFEAPSRPMYSIGG